MPARSPAASPIPYVAAPPPFPLPRGRVRATTGSAQCKAVFFVRSHPHRRPRAARAVPLQEARAHSSYWDWQERLARQRGDLTGVARALQKSVSPLQSNPPAWHRLALATRATAEAEAQPVRRPFWTLAAVLAAQKAWSEVSVRARHTEPSSFAQTTYATELSAVAEARARILAFARSPPYHPVADDATTLAAQAAHLATELAARTASGDEELSTHDGLLKALHAFAAVCPPAWLSSPSLEPALPPETAEVASWWSDTALQMVEARRNDPTASLDAEAPAPALDSGSDGDASDGDGDGAGAASANSDGKARPSAQRRGASGGRRGGAFG